MPKQTAPGIHCYKGDSADLIKESQICEGGSGSILEIQSTSIINVSVSVWHCFLDMFFSVCFFFGKNPDFPSQANTPSNTWCLRDCFPGRGTFREGPACGPVWLSSGRLGVE